MANTAGAFGLRPVRYRNGSPWNGKTTPYYVRSDDATALFRGDPVVMIGEGNQVEISGFPAGSLSAVTIATAGDTPGIGTLITGVMWGMYDATRESLLYRAASTEQIIFVIDDPNVVFQIQDSGDGAPDYDWIGLNAVLKSGAGVAATGLSGWMLDANTDPPAADQSNQLIIEGLSRIPNNELGDYATWDVLINQHMKVQPVLGIA
jgi:hypothetical protein